MISPVQVRIRIVNFSRKNNVDDFRMRLPILIGISSIRSEFVATHEWQIVPGTFFILIIIQNADDDLKDGLRGRAAASWLTLFDRLFYRRTKS